MSIAPRPLLSHRPYPPSPAGSERADRVVQVHLGDYGCDANGLICGWHFLPGRAGVAIAAEQAHEWLDAGGRDGIVWLHFSLSHNATENWLRRHAGQHDDFFAALHEGSRSSRIERDGDTLFAVINDVTYHFSFDAGDIATLWVSARASLVVSVRRHPLRAVDRLRATVERGPAVEPTVHLPARLLRYQAEELQQIVRSAAEQVDDIEDHVVAEENNRSLFLLTMVTVLALPINLSAGLLGMNVSGIPFAHGEHGFWIVLLLIVVVTLVAARLVWRRLADKR